MSCPRCGRENPREWHGSGVCYACHLASIRFGFGPNGRDWWRDAPTINEQLRTAKEKAAARGDTLVPMGARWV